MHLTRDSNPDPEFWSTLTHPKKGNDMLLRTTRSRSIASALIVIPMALALGACGGGSGSGDSSTASPGGTTSGGASGDVANGKVVFTETANPPCSG